MNDRLHDVMTTAEVSQRDEFGSKDRSKCSSSDGTSGENANHKTKKAQLLRTKIKLRRGGKKKISKKALAAEESLIVEAPSTKGLEMTRFFDKIASIRDDVEALKSATRLIRGEYNDRVLMATTARDEEKASLKLKQLVGEANKQARRAKTELERLKEQNDKLRSSRGSQDDSQLRMRLNVCSALTKTLADEICEFRKAQEKYQTELKRKATRQVQTVKPDVTEEEITTIMRIEGGRDALYQKLILNGVVNAEVRAACEIVDGKYRDILTLEQSLEELRQLFLDVALLTEQQGEMLDRIEFHVQEANDHVGEGNENLIKSNNYLKKIMKKRRWIVIILAVAIIVVILPVAL